MISIITVKKKYQKKRNLQDLWSWSGWVLILICLSFLYFFFCYYITEYILETSELHFYFRNKKQYVISEMESDISCHSYRNLTLIYIKS